jgi:hypothetical protein
MWTKEQRAIYWRDEDRYPSNLTDAEWKQLEPVIPDTRQDRPRGLTSFVCRFEFAFTIPPRRAVMSYDRPSSFLTGLERPELEKIRLILAQKIFRKAEA